MPPTTAVSSVSNTVTPEPDVERQELEGWMSDASKLEIVEFYVKKDQKKSERMERMEDKINSLVQLKHLHQKELDTKNFLIEKLKKERTKLQGENKILTKNTVTPEPDDEWQELELEYVELLQKNANLKFESIDKMEDHINDLVQINHLREEIKIEIETELKKVLKREKINEARHQKELNTKNFLIEQLKEERTKLQGENKILTKNLNDEVLELQNIVNAVKGDNDKLRKEVKAKTPKQQINSKKSAPPVKETDVKQLEAANKKLQLEKQELQQALADVLEKHEQIICCRICEEKYDDSEERVPVKLKCSHVFCASCANSWLAAQGQKATCPQCRTIYRAGDIKPVNFNL